MKQKIQLIKTDLGIADFNTEKKRKCRFLYNYNLTSY